MNNNDIVKIGAALKWRNTYDPKKTYYQENITTLGGSVFRCKALTCVGKTPIGEKDSVGHITFANTDVWDVVVDMTEYYNWALDSNLLAKETKEYVKGVQDQFWRQQAQINALQKVDNTHDEEIAALKQADQDLSDRLDAVGATTSIKDLNKAIRKINKAQAVQDEAIVTLGEHFGCFSDGIWINAGLWEDEKLWANDTFDLSAMVNAIEKNIQDIADLNPDTVREIEGYFSAFGTGLWSDIFVWNEDDLWLNDRETIRITEIEAMLIEYAEWLNKHDDVLKDYAEQLEQHNKNIQENLRLISINTKAIEANGEAIKQNQESIKDNKQSILQLSEQHDEDVATINTIREADQKELRKQNRTLAKEQAAQDLKITQLAEHYGCFADGRYGVLSLWYNDEVWANEPNATRILENERDIASNKQSNQETQQDLDHVKQYVCCYSFGLWDNEYPWSNEDCFNTALVGVRLAELNLQVNELEKFKKLNNSAIDKIMYNGDQGKAYLGNVCLQEPGMTDYCIIMMYGQSLSNGSENPAGFYDEPVDGCYMLGGSVWNTSGNVLQPLSVGGTKRSDGVATGTRQDTIVSTVNSFVTLYRKERPWDKNTKFIACSLGVGGRTVSQLSGMKYANGQNTTRRYPMCNEANLDSRVKPFFEAVKAIADSEGKTISLSAVFWKQGEADYGTGYIGKTYDEWKTIVDAKTTTDNNAMQGCRDAYYKGLTTLKEDIFALAKQVFGDEQSARPIFMPYSVCGTYINNAYMTINDATAQMADEQDDVVQVGPTYVTPDYNGGHLAMNGYRWFGEYCAKALYYMFLKHIDWRPMQPYNYEVKDNKVYIYINPIVPPLRFDKYTIDGVYKNLGFSVRMGTVASLDANKNMSSGGLLQTITDIQIIENCIVLTCGNIEKFKDAIEVSYAGQGESGYSGHNQGAGNLRDSDTWNALYAYREDSGDHGSINGNWTALRVATEDDLKNYQYWDATFASSTGYDADDICLFDDIATTTARVIQSKTDDNKSTPYNPVNYRTQNVKGATIVGKKYPMQNWCLNFYKRIVL